MAKRVGSEAKSNSRGCFTFVRVTTPTAPRTPLPTKFAAAEKHIGRWIIRIGVALQGILNLATDSASSTQERPPDLQRSNELHPRTNSVQVLQHRHRRIPTVDSDHASARMSTCAAHVHSLHRRSRAQPVRPHVLRQALALEDMPAREPHLLLDIRRPQHLCFNYRRVHSTVADIAAEPCQRLHRKLSHFLAPSIPVALRKLVRHILRKHTHRV